MPIRPPQEDIDRHVQMTTGTAHVPHSPLPADAPFWYVYREGGDAPQYRHGTKAEAVNEADRLAVLCPGMEFHVLKCVASVKASRVHWVERAHSH